MYIVADIGGTKTRIARSHDLETFDEPIIYDTPHPYEEGIRVFITRTLELAQGEPIERVVIGLPGAFNADRRSLFNAPNLGGWNKYPIADDLEHALNTLVTLENDTALVGLGEAAVGAGVGASIMVYVTVSTGIGGVRIVNGAVDANVYGFEIGHQYLFIENEPKELCDLISGTAVVEKYHIQPKELGLGAPVWDEFARYLAFGLHNTILHWSPNRIVLGGSMFNEIGISIDAVRAQLDEIMHIFPTVPEIVHSSLGNTGGLYGGLARLKQLH
jgi:glucokinase